MVSIRVVVNLLVLANGIPRATAFAPSTVISTPSAITVVVKTPSSSSIAQRSEYAGQSLRSRTPTTSLPRATTRASGETRRRGASSTSTTRLLASATSIDKFDAAVSRRDPSLARRERSLFELRTLVRVLLPAVLAGVLAFLALPGIRVSVAIFVCRVTVPAKIGSLVEVVSSFIGLVGLLYSILMGQVFGFLYSQQEALYYALFDEVTEAKSLLEQVALVSQGRTMYSTCLGAIARYVREDLLGGTSSQPKSTVDEATMGSVNPSVILSARPKDDPLEAILYLTSVGVPGQVYDTVRSLRQARARRLGALQRKVPAIHLIMLWILGGIMTVSFPMLVGVGEAAAAGGLQYREAFPFRGLHFRTLPGALFGVATFAVSMTQNVLVELWRTRGGAYNVDAVLRVMVRGLQKELDERMAEARKIMKRSKKEE